MFDDPDRLLGPLAPERRFGRTRGGDRATDLFGQVLGRKLRLREQQSEAAGREPLCAQPLLCFTTLFERHQDGWYTRVDKVHHRVVAGEPDESAGLVQQLAEIRTSAL